MTAGTIMTGGEGERLHAARRKRFWMIFGGLMAVGVVGGVIGGFVTEVNESGGVLSPTMVYLAAAGVLITVALFIYGSWKFFGSVDEVEVADNLWGSLIGFYAYAILLPSWWAFDKLGLVPEPNDWAIYGASLIIALIAYGYRKWRFG